jgi:hypothetical protein
MRRIFNDQRDDDHDYDDYGRKAATNYLGSRSLDSCTASTGNDRNGKMKTIRTSSTDPGGVKPIREARESVKPLAHQYAQGDNSAMFRDQHKDTRTGKQI